MSDPISSKRQQLYRKAEEVLQSLPDDKNHFDPRQIYQLLQDLQVHQIELEIQNEELQRVQKELESTRMQYMRLFQNAPVGYVVLDQNGIILQANATFSRMIGSEQSTVTGGGFAALLSNEDETIFRSRYRSFFRNPAGKSMEVQVKGASGPFDARLEAVPQYRNDNTGVSTEYCELLMTVSDISDRKSAERQLFEQREYLLTTLRSIGEGVITTDIHGTITLMNSVAEHLTGWSEDTALGKPLSTIFSLLDERREPIGVHPFERVIASGQLVGQACHVLVSREGIERIIEDTGAPIRSAQGDPIGAVFVFRDVTEKRRLLETANRMDKLDSLGVLAGGIAHDFNNLLCGIFGYLEMARDSCDNNPLVTTFLNKALSVYDRAKNLTHQFLTFAKGGLPVKKVCDIVPLVKDNVSFALSGSNIVCEYRLESEAWHCEIDENQMGQVINNIVLNALQAMPDGGKFTVSATNTREGIRGSVGAGRYVKLSFTDTGCGISSDALKRIFDPFFTTKPMGNGLGLTTCYSIIKKHGGHIEVESELGSGTTVSLFVPASYDRPSDVSDVINCSHRGSGTILIMDDEECVRDVAHSILSAMGYSVIEAKGGEDVFSILRNWAETSSRLVAVILDLTIPGGIGGKETLGTVRSLFPDLPIFASSGYFEDPVMANPGLFGFTDRIRKPYRRQELSELLDRHLKKNS